MGEDTLVSERPTDIEAVVFDLDGVIWHEYEAIVGAADAVAFARELGLGVAFLTNTSSRSEQYLARQLRAAGIWVKRDCVYTSGRIAAQYLADRYRGTDVVAVVHGARNVFLKQVETAGMRAVALEDLTSDVAGVGDDSQLVVAIGYSRRLSYDDVATLLTLAPKVTEFYAPERDRWFGAAAGPKPGAGWIVAAAEEVLAQPATVLGKPNPECLRIVAADLGVDVSRVLMVGDSVASDIAAARAAGAVSCLFAPGTAVQAADQDNRADHVISHLDQIRTILLEGTP